jgi:hypothetical protein
MADRVQVIFGADDQEFRDKLGKVEKSLNSFSDSVFSLRSALAGAGITAVVASAVQAANQLERATIGLAVTARYVGYSFDEVNTAAKKLTQDGLMSVTEASQALQNLLSRGYSLKEAVDMMNRLKDSAAFNRQAHLEFGQSIVGATEGLKNENSVLVDNAGVTKNVSIMWKEYAAEHGKSVDKLTQAEKRQAEYNGIMKETEGQVGNAARMTDTFSGSQARFNQKLFEAKAVLGTSLQPALTGVLSVAVTLVEGFKNLVAWVEILGATAGYHFERLKNKFNVNISGEEAAKRNAQLKDALLDQIDEIVKKTEGKLDSPNIGKDSGKRRKDTVIPEKQKPAKYDTNWAKDWALTYETAQFPMTEAMMNERGIMSYNQAEQLKQRSWADRNSGTDMMEYQDQFNAAAFDSARTASMAIALQKETEFNAMRLQLADEGKQQQLLNIQTEEDAWMQSWAMQTDSFEEHERRKLLIQQYYDNQRKAVLMEGTTNRLAFEQASGQKQVQMITSAGVAMTQGVANTNRAMFMANKAFRMIEAGMELKAGIIKTWNSWPYPYNIPMTALHVAAGASQLIDLASSSYGGGGGASTPGGGYGGGTLSSPIVTQPVSTPSESQGNITIVLKGLPMGKWVEEELVPEINRAGSRNVKIEYAGA